MPIKARFRPQRERSVSPVPSHFEYVEIPNIEADDSFQQVVKSLSRYIDDAIETPSSFEQLRTTAAGSCLRMLIDHLDENCSNPAIVSALLALKWHYGSGPGDHGLGETRSNACEIVAWRFLTRRSEREAVDYCLFEIPSQKKASSQDREQNNSATQADQAPDHGNRDTEPGERTPLLTPRVLATFDGQSSLLVPAGGTAAKRTRLLSSLDRLTNSSGDEDQADQNDDSEPATAFAGLNALEIAAVADAKRFLSQHVVQKIVAAIWNGDICFWDSLAVNSSKHAHFYNPKTADPFSRLRVPKYLKSWEILFFAVFLCLYYAVLLDRHESHITGPEIALFIWIAAYFYDELSELLDAGSIFYATDIWNVFDMIMILIGAVFAGLRIYGLVHGDRRINDLAFDVLALEALFMVPRICSILSLSPYWGTLIPCLKEMGKDFIKYMVLIVVVYLGFLTTFSLIGRDKFTFLTMLNVLTKIFYGSSATGFEIMHLIDPIFGPPLMIMFITLSSFLLMGSLTGMLSSSFSRVITHAKEEYLYVYSVYVLEASTSNRLTHFYPPFNLIALVIFRPWRFFIRRERGFRAGRIWLLKLTHSPLIALIKMYEYIKRGNKFDEFAGFKGRKVGGKRRRASDPGGTRPGTGASNSKLLGPRAFVKPDASKAAGDDEGAAKPSVDAQIGELSNRIDQLTSVILALRAEQAKAGAPATTA
ncbi:Calcium channel YVC1 [Escovopsis weberi]|uniref:Calcium channel YVC1 n=1 Tax=Escovopsis weberi TaxID=150374 RepID=A0A0M8N0Y2_ESCWE|nr:Calcium channel YVC1 [Escovopsis weberi]